MTIPFFQSVLAIDYSAPFSTLGLFREWFYFFRALCLVTGDTYRGYYTVARRYGLFSSLEDMDFMFSSLEHKIYIFSQPNDVISSIYEIIQLYN